MTLPATAGGEETAWAVPPGTTGRMGATAVTSRFRSMTSSLGSTSTPAAAQAGMAAREAEAVLAARGERVAFRPTPATRTAMADREAMAVQAVMAAKVARAVM